MKAGRAVGVDAQPLDAGDGMAVEQPPFHRLGEGGFKVVEVAVDGRSLGSALETHRAPFLHQPGGDVAELLVLQVGEVAQQPRHRLVGGPDVGLGPGRINLVDEARKGVRPLAASHRHGVVAGVGPGEHVLGAGPRLGRRHRIGSPDLHAFAAAVFHVVAHDAGRLDPEDEPLELGITDLERAGSRLEILQQAIADDGLNIRPPFCKCKITALS